jgi:HK97 family phage major capsid protein
MPDDGNVLGLIEQLGRTFEEFKSTHERQLAELKAGKQDALTVEKMAKIDAELDRLSEQQKTIATTALEAAKLAGRPGGAAKGDRDLVAETKAFNQHRVAALKSGRIVEATVEEYKGYRDAFAELLRKGKDAVDLDRKTLAVGIDSDGGFVVPPDMSGQIVTRLFETSPMRAIASAQTISTDKLEGLRDTDEAASGGWVSETQPRPATGTPQLGRWQIPVNEQFANPDATQQMLDDAAIDIEGWLSQKITDKLARVENAAFVNGDGIAKPRGFANYATVAQDDAARPWGALEHFVTGVNGGFPSSNPSDVLMDLLGRFKEGYLPGARWVTRRSVITLIRKFKDGQGQYLWIPGLLQGAQETLLGFPITKFEDLPALASNGNSLWFGDFRRGYQIVDRQGIRVLRDPYSNKPFVQFYTTKRVGGDVVQFEAIKALRFST